MPLDDSGQLPSDSLASAPAAAPAQVAPTPAAQPTDQVSGASDQTSGQPPDIRGLIDQSRKMGATDDQIRDLMVKAPFLASTWQASEKAGIPPDAVFEHFGLAPPAPPPDDASQSQAAADVNAVGQGLVSGTGAVIAGAGRQATAAGARMTQQQLAAMDAIDQGQDIPAEQDPLGYQSMSPAQRLQARADMKAADADQAKREPNALTQAGTAMENAAPTMFQVVPENEGIQTGIGRAIGGMGPAVAASAAGSAVGGPVGGVLAGAVAIGSQAYDGTYQEAVAKGSSPEQAEDAAGKAAMGQIAALSLPIGKVIPLIPAPLREGFVKTLVNLGQEGIEIGGGNAMGTLAQNYVASQTYDPDRPLTQGIGTAGLEGTIAGLVVRGGGAAFSAAAAKAASDSAIADIAAAPDVDTAIAAAAKATSAASQPQLGWSDLFASSAPPEAATSAENAQVAPEGQSAGGIPQTAAPADIPSAPSASPAVTGAPATAADARNIASGYYRQAELLGGELKPDFTNRFIDSAEKIAPQTEEGRIVTGDTAVTSLVDRMQGLRDHPLSLQAAQEIDEALGGLIDKETGVTGISKEGKNLLDLQTTLRGMIEKADPADVEGGTAGFDALGPARRAWSQAAKMGDVERIINRAQLTDNPATSIKSGIRTLLSNPSRVRGYTDDEIDALKDAASRGVIGGALHVFGSRLTPLIAGSIGMSGGPIGGLAAAGISHVAGAAMRNAASSIQAGRVQNALSVIGSNVPPAVAQAIQEAAPAKTEQTSVNDLTKLRSGVLAGTVSQNDPMIRDILHDAYGDDLGGEMSRAKLAGILANFANDLQKRAGSGISAATDQITKAQ